MGRRWGKTYMAGVYALTAADFGAAVAWVAPTYKNSRPLWRFVEQMTAPAKNRVRVNRTERIAEFPSGGWIGVYTADNDVTMRGESFDLVIGDEAAQYKPETYSDVIMPTLADRDGRCVLISTPKGKNWFWREFVNARADGKDRMAFQAPTSANPLPNIQKAFGMARERVPERTFQQEWLAQFIDDGGGVFRRVRECAIAVAQDAPIPGHVYCFGVDWARTNDYTVISVIDATINSLVAIDRFNQIDYRTQTDRLVALYERFRPSTIISEGNSMGGPLTEDLQARGLPVWRFDTTAQTKMPLIQALELAFERETIHIINDETLIGELQAYEQERTATGIRYGAPEGMHDDCVISLALAYHGMNHSGSIFL